MKIKEIKRIDCNKLQNLCINSNWYTAGNTEDYDNMFKMCRKENITLQQLYKITKDIYDHTNLEVSKQGCYPGYTEEENIVNMMIYVNDCAYIFYEITQ